LFGTFVFFSHTVYEWCNLNKPKDYRYPQYKELWMAGVGFVFFGLLASTIEFITS